MAPNAAAGVIADLRAESDDLDRLVADLPASEWATPTPAEGWTIAHQIAHLLWTDRVALTSITDEPGFGEVLATAAQNPTGFVDRAAEELAELPPPPQGPHRRGGPEPQPALGRRRSRRQDGGRAAPDVGPPP